jgi:uncharacterized protein (TIGR04168 family)
MPDPSRDSARILFVGDVHGHWSELDARFVEGGDQDLLVFVGDLGDEDVGIVREISSVDCELGVLLGNHDAWQSFTLKRPTEALRESLALLGEDHLAYRLRDLPEAGITLLGARPFSWGGKDIRSPELYRELYDISSHEESAERLIELAARARFDDLVVVAHNGPLGLGAAPSDIWGKDFGKPGGDWGDRDLQLALAGIRETGKRVRAVVAGHMHDRLFAPRGGLRRRFVHRGATSYLNCAVVPRVRRLADGVEARHYLRTDWRAGRLAAVDEIWVDAAGAVLRVDPVSFEAAGHQDVGRS